MKNRTQTTLPYQWDGQGDPLVLIAGLGGKGASWQPFLQAAARRLRLSTLPTPTLVVSGTDDGLMPAQHAEELAKAIPAGRLAYIPEAGHLAYLEGPELFARIVLGYLKSEAES